MSVKPITPEEATSAKADSLPESVLLAFNELIAKNFDGRMSEFTQKEAEALLVKKGIKRSDIYEQGYMDVEDIYREAGWRVTYDKPGYNESYDAKFTFERKTKG